MRMFLVAAFLVNAGCLASALSDTEPWTTIDQRATGFTADNSPTCFKSCKEYSSLGQCNAPWSGCKAGSTLLIKDFCQASCATTTAVSAGTANGKWCGTDGECASGNCCGGLLGIIFQVCGECCEDRHCPAGYNCYNGWNANFKCGTAKGNGEACDQDSDCASGHCIDGGWFAADRCRECDDHSHCNNGRYTLATAGRRICEDNACIEPKPTGNSCGKLFAANDDEECKSGHCCWGACRECCEDSHCANGKNCKFLSMYCED